jgi:LPXTG-motif cell wall-anchored protein
MKYFVYLGLVLTLGMMCFYWPTTATGQAIALVGFISGLLLTGGLVYFRRRKKQNP